MEEHERLKDAEQGRSQPGETASCSANAAEQQLFPSLSDDGYKAVRDDLCENPYERHCVQLFAYTTTFVYSYVPRFR